MFEDYAERGCLVKLVFNEDGDGRNCARTECVAICTAVPPSAIATSIEKSEPWSITIS